MNRNFKILILFVSLLLFICGCTKIQEQDVHSNEIVDGGYNYEKNKNSTTDNNKKEPERVTQKAEYDTSNAGVKNNQNQNSIEEDSDLNADAGVKNNQNQNSIEEDSDLNADASSSGETKEENGAEKPQKSDSSDIEFDDDSGWSSGWK